MTGDLQYWKELEGTSRRPTSEAAHPDACAKLKINGVAWAVPSRGARLVPTFADGKASFAVAGEEQYPEAVELVRLVGESRQEKTCPTCGQVTGATLEVDLDRNRAILDTAATLAAKLLRRQYNLTDEQLGEILAFSAEAAPEWLGLLVRWASGLPIEGAMPADLPADWPGYPEALAPEDAPRRGWLQRLLRR